MPIIATFFGIVIRMFYQEHDPRISMWSIKANRPSATSAGK
jgi:hypothetical protein